MWKLECKIFRLKISRIVNYENTRRKKLETIYDEDGTMELWNQMTVKYNYSLKKKLKWS